MKRKPVHFLALFLAMLPWLIVMAAIGGVVLVCLLPPQAGRQSGDCGGAR